MNFLDPRDDVCVEAFFCLYGFAAASQGEGDFPNPLAWEYLFTGKPIDVGKECERRMTISLFPLRMLQF